MWATPMPVFKALACEVECPSSTIAVSNLDFGKVCGAEINFGAKLLFYTAFRKFARQVPAIYYLQRFAVNMAASSEPFYVRY